MKKTITTVIFCITFALWIFEIASQDASSMASKDIIKNEKFDKEFSGIATVTDGDTIKVEGKRVRFIGIDAPETSQLCFDANYQEYKCGIVSTNFLKQIAEQKEVVCYYSHFDKYQRYLAECYVGSMMLNTEMLRNGMAVIYSFSKVDPEVQKIEDEARKNKIGIWQGAFQLPKDYRKEKKAEKAAQ